MALPTNRQHGDVIDPVDINNISAEVNALWSQSGTSGPGDGGGTTDHAALTNRDAPDQHPIGAVTGLQTALDGKSATGHTHSIAQVADLQEELNYKAEKGHQHAPEDITGSTSVGRSVLTASSATAARTAIGAGTSSLQIGTGSTTAAAGNHTHDDRYYTEAEVNTALSGKANTNHQHPVSQITTTGTPDGTKFLRDDGAWATPASGGGGPVAQQINLQTGTTYTLVATDFGKVVLLSNTSPITLTVPTEVFSAGERVDLIQIHTGSVTVVAGLGLTLNGSPSLVLRGRWSAASVVFLTPDEAVVIGDLATP